MAFPCASSCDSTQVVSFLVNNTVQKPEFCNNAGWCSNQRIANTTAATSSSCPYVTLPGGLPNLPEGQIPWQIMGSSAASGSQGWSYFFNSKGGIGPVGTSGVSFPQVAGTYAGYPGGNLGQGGWQTWLSTNGAKSDVGPGYSGFLSSLNAAQTAGKKIQLSLGGFNMQQNMLQDGDQTAGGPHGNTQTAQEFAAALAQNLCNISPSAKTTAAGILATAGTDLYGNFEAAQCPFRDLDGNHILFDGIDLDIEHADPIGQADLLTLAQTLKSLGVLVSIPIQAPQLLNAVPSPNFSNLGFFQNAMANNAFPTPAQIQAGVAPLAVGNGLLQQSGIVTSGTTNVDQLCIQFYNQGFTYFLDWVNSESLPSASYGTFVSQMAQWAYFFKETNASTKLFVGISNAQLGCRQDPTNTTSPYICTEGPQNNIQVYQMMRGFNFYFNGTNNPNSFPGPTTAANALWIGTQVKQAVLDTTVALQWDNLDWFGGMMVYSLPDSTEAFYTDQYNNNTKYQYQFANLARTVTSITGGTLVAQDGANAGDPSVSFGPSGSYPNEVTSAMPQTIPITISGDVGSVLIGSSKSTVAPWPTSVTEGQNILITGTGGAVITQVLVNPNPQPQTSQTILYTTDRTACMLSFAQLTSSWPANTTIEVSTSPTEDIQLSLINSGQGHNNRPLMTYNFGVPPKTIGITVGIICGIAVPLIVLLIWLTLQRN